MAECRFSEGELRKFVVSVIKACGGDGEAGELVADALLWADVRGLSAHGIAGKLPHLVELARRTHATLRVPREDPCGDRAVGVFDGGDGLAQVTGSVAMRRAVDVSASAGIGVRLVRNTNTTAALGAFADIALRRGVIGIAITNGPAMVGAPGAAEPVLGNQGHAFAFPSEDGVPVVFDSSLSSISQGTVRAAAAKGELLQSGALRDARGNEIRDARSADGAIFQTIGGHKGFGLALVFELLTSVLAGSDHVGGQVEGSGHSDVTLMCAAVDPNATIGRAAYASRVVELKMMLTQTRMVEPDARLRIPGVAGHRRAVAAAARGVEYTAAQAGVLGGLARELSLPEPVAIGR